MTEIESRHVLQAWTFLSASGVQAPLDVATEVLAALAEVSVPGGHDLLIGYQDRSTRYLNVSGKVLVLDGRISPEYIGLMTTWLTVAEWLAGVIGVSDQPELPALPSGHTRIMMLTPAGARFGQGPGSTLRADKEAATFLAAATAVLTVVTRAASDTH